MATVKDSGREALEKLKSTEPPVFLSPSSISEVARVASQYLFTKLKPYSPKSPFDELLVDGFDAEQIWQQIDMQSQPLLSSLKQEVKRFASNPKEISELGNLVLKEEDVDEMDMDGFDSDDDEEEEEVEANDEDDEDEDEEEDEEKGGEEEEEEEEEKNEVEDKFFKLKELEAFLEDGEAEEYGLDHKNKKGDSKQHGFSDDEDDDEDEDEIDEDEEDDEDEEEDEEFGLLAGGDDEKLHKVGKPRYEDFFGGKKKETKKKLKDVFSEDEDEDEDEASEKLSTHEKARLKVQSKIEQMEKAALDPKHWTMQGEVTAAKRPKNSALEVDLDFEHNARPAPVTTVEHITSLENLIKSRIIEGRFDDVQPAPGLPTKTKRELREVDDNKSKRGLAEVYEAEYVQKANPAFTPLTHSDELKKEAAMLFKKLCMKLDALSHFHFAPKPVIEEMSIQTNVPAIAMEEVAPVAVSDAAMLAPEEIFAGKGNIKDESELTQEDRKRRRAKKKRKFKAESANQPLKKPLDSTTENSKTVTGGEEL